MIERARRLSRPYLEREGTIGIYLLGSATRPYSDPRSDLDIEVIVDDATYRGTPDEERQRFVLKEEPPPVVDYEFYLRPWSEFVGLIDSTHDLFHYAYQHAVVLHDPRGRIVPVIERLAELPEAIRRERMAVHLLEFRHRLARARKTARRGERPAPINLGLLYADALRALVKLLFVVRRSWAATAHWSEQELRLLGIPDRLLERASALLHDSGPEDGMRLIEDVEGFLDGCGETFHRDGDALRRWLFFTAAGKRAFERWGLR